MFEKKEIKKRENFVIVDANSIVHSAFHGYQPQYNLKNEDNRVLYGIIQELVNLTFNIPDISYIYMVFDPDDGSLYRKSLYSLYKANRPEMDKDLYRQKLVAKKVIEDHLGIPVLSYSGYEADDIIGTLANIARDNYNVIIVSPDKDLAQLVETNIMLLRKIRTKNEKGYRGFKTPEIITEFGVNPLQIPDWLALVGDTADNLPGIAGVGGKGASKLLSTYPSIEHLLSVLGELKNEKLKEKIKDNKETLILVKKLATIVCDLPLEKAAYRSIEKADHIRNLGNYNDKLDILEKHYQWPNYFSEMFRNN